MSHARILGTPREVQTEPRQRELLDVPQPTAAPTVWLLTTGWRRWGPLAFDEVGGAKEVKSLGGR